MIRIQSKARKLYLYLYLNLYPMIDLINNCQLINTSLSNLPFEIESYLFLVALTVIKVEQKIPIACQLKLIPRKLLHLHSFRFDI